ncbi:MAG: hypothetical protein M3Y82_14280, partial [Verrucomicrobiota bacterium]|nr:hypothetical protein [Verrucomicrobiota bacterium]
MKKWFPWVLTAIFAAWILSAFAPAKNKNNFRIKEFGELPVLLNGRIQPFDSVGKNALLSMSGKSTARAEDKKSLSASEWLLEALTKPDEANKRKIFRIQHPDLEGLLGTQNAKLEYYSFNDLTNQLEQIERQAQSLIKSELDENGRPREDLVKLRTPFQKDLMHLYDSVILFHRIKNSLQPEGAKDFPLELEIYQETIPLGRAALEQSEAGKEFDKQDLQVIAGFFRRYQTMSKFGYPLAVPPNAGQPRDAWKNVGSSLMESMRDNEIHPAVNYFAKITSAYAKNQPADFNKAVSEYRGWLQSNNLLRELKKGREEFFFNHLEPFYKAMVIYVAA